jgi:predicted Zn-dependent protease
LTLPLAIFLLAGVGSSAIASEPSDRTLRDEADREAERLSRIAKVHDEPALDSYLTSVVSRLMAGSPLASDAPPIRVTVLRDVAPSAFMLPNARLFVHTGLLARLDNEAQLAAVLGRETVHLTAHHALRADRDAPDTSGQGVSSPLPIQGLPLTYTAAVTGYGRDLEREADAGGLTRVVLAGYDPREALLAFERLREEPAQPSRSERYYLSNRVRLDERLAGARKWLQANGPETSFEAFTSGSEDYALRTRLAVRENAGLEIRAGRYGLGRRQLDRVLSLTPGDPVAHLYYGDLHRLAAQRTRRPEDRAPLIEQAREAYARAIALDPAFPDPFRQLGFLYYQTRDNPRAREAFERYLALNPDAPDARRVKEYLIELER